MSETYARRPWCLPCREGAGLRTWASVLGVACEWHWGILSDDDQRALQVAVLKEHPRGGRVTSVIEQIVVVRMTLRQSKATVEATWRADAEQLDRERDD